jgi:hypothetical protein
LEADPWTRTAGCRHRLDEALSKFIFGTDLVEVSMPSQREQARGHTDNNHIPILIQIPESCCWMVLNSFIVSIAFNAYYCIVAAGMPSVRIRK